MVEFDKLSAKNVFGPNFVSISFSIKDTIEDMTNYSFDLLRSNAINGTFSLIYSNIQRFECNDYSAILSNPEILYFYKIVARNVMSGERMESVAFATPPAKEDEYTFYFNELYNMYLDFIGNGEVLLLKKIRTGQRCNCYDDIRGSRMGDNCEECFGTGYKGGYYPPIKIKVNYFNASSKQEDMDIKGTFESNSPVQLWTLNHPIIQENDIIVDVSTGLRSTIMNWQPSYKNGYLIRQTAQAVKIPEGSLLYKIPL